MKNKFIKNKWLKEKFGFIRIDFSFFLIFILAWFLGEVLRYFLFILFLVLHELSHFLVAKKLGYLPKKIRLSFFGASLEGYDDFLFKDEIKIILAGPLFNFSVIILCLVISWFNPELYEFTYEIIIINKAILLFNILPIFPLDFGRILLVILTKKFGRKNALETIKFISICFIICAFCFFVISLFYNYNFTVGFVLVNLTNLCLKSANGTSYKRELFFEDKFKILKKGLPEKKVYVLNGTPDYKLLKFLSKNYYTIFVFVDENFKEISTLKEIDLLHKLYLY